MKEWWFHDKDRVKVTIYLFVFLINLFIIFVLFYYILNYHIIYSPVFRGADSPRVHWSEGTKVRGLV